MSENKTKLYDKGRSLSDRDTAREKMSVFFETTDNYYHPFREVCINNTIDEISNNFDKGNIYITLHDDNRTLTVFDEGRGMPINLQDDNGDYYWYLYFQKLFASGKYDLENEENSGTNGVGNAVTNYNSEFDDIISYFDGQIWHIRFEDGGNVKIPLENLGETNKHGTKITFKLDENCFSSENTIYDVEKLKDIIDKACSVSPKVTIYFTHNGETTKYHYDTPMVDYFKNNISKDEFYSFDKKEYIKQNKKGKNEKNNVQIIFNKSFAPIQLTFLNNNNLIKGGTPNKGFCQGLSKIINDFGIENKLFDKVVKSVSEKDVESATNFMITLGSSNVEYTGQAKFGTNKSMYAQVVKDYLNDVMEIEIIENKDKFIDFCKHVIEIARLNSKFKEKKKSIKQNKVKRVSSDKLTRCETTNKKIKEFIAVEGLSPAGAVRGGNFKKFQSVLATRGKIPNAIKKSFDIIQNNEELSIFNQEMGLNYKTYNEEDVLYDKFIIMSDADVDGLHIRCLWIAYCYKYHKKLIENGHVYISVPPLYLITKKNNKKVFKYCYSDDEKEIVVKDFGDYNNVEIQRYKGLGEMNSDQLRETTLDPEKRLLYRVTIKDAEKMMEMLNILMDDDSDLRKEFYLKNSELCNIVE